jgi:hypothetical protein
MKPLLCNYNVLRIGSFLFLSLCLVGCDRAKRERDSTGPDFALRVFLDVRSIVVSRQMPKKDPVFLVTMLEFEDGKLARRGLASYGKVKSLPGRELKVEVLWSKEKPAVWMFGVMAASTQTEFWRKLDGTIVSSGARGEYNGYKIIAFAYSDVRRDGGTRTPGDDDFEGALARQKYVGALGLKTFKTEDEAREAVSMLN